MLVLSKSEVKFEVEAMEAQEVYTLVVKALVIKDSKTGIDVVLPDVVGINIEPTINASSGVFGSWSVVADLIGNVRWWEQSVDRKGSRSNFGLLELGKLGSWK
ncbi:hypothetical protein F0562_025985 [Nyssa sinensis]|uniref:Uncharacterized protein n=1 Tax=Nyssa sinensis TaxID=561372 RepID=A0A5J5B7S5_9ASTE|nr:hypothetical protein F0562_025985 [Nyssa sinensis]